MDRDSTYNPLRKRFYDLIIVFQWLNNKASQCTAILLGYNHVLRHVYQPSGQVSRIRSFQSRIGKSLTGTVGRNKALQYIETFLKVGKNRGFDDSADRTLKVFLWLGHQAPHPAHLTDLLSGTPRAGVHHHVDGIEALLVFLHLLHQDIG